MDQRQARGHHGSGVYRPTSLDFINRPNPVEPQSVPHRHPLNRSPQLGVETTQNQQQELIRVLLGAQRQCGSHKNADIADDSERPSKRRRSGDARESTTTASTTKALALPKPPVRQKRLRIPPTLSGLHHPPPNAGLLPSISVDQPGAAAVQDSNRSAPYTSKTGTGTAENTVGPKQSKSALGPSASKSDSQLPTSSKPAVQVSAPARQGTKKAPHAAKGRQRRKWSDDETACLLQGVSRFGMGNWTKILNCDDYHFHARTALDLKDRFRVCCPEHYKGLDPPRNAKLDDSRAVKDLGGHADGGIKVSGLIHDGEAPPADASTAKKSGAKSSSDLQALGINLPFKPVSRRKRHGYSEAEDEALLRGFKLYGKAWALIRDDESLGLEERTSTDLRDRMRTRYPSEYKSAGLALKTDERSKETIQPAASSRPGIEQLFENAPKSSQESDTAQLAASPSQPSNTTHGHDETQALDPRGRRPGIARPSQHQTSPTTSSTLHHPHPPRPPAHSTAPPPSQPPQPPPSFFSSLSFSFPFDDELLPSLPFDLSSTADDFIPTSTSPNDRPTLDRGILDWPTDQTHMRYASITTNAGIDPSKISVKPYHSQPQPWQSTSVQHPALHRQSSAHSVISSARAPSHNAPSTQSITTTGAALPSLAALTAQDVAQDLSSGEQLELPSLVLGSSGAAGDVSRIGGGHFLGLDELLS